MENVDPAVIKAVGAFAGGIAATGSVCGSMLAGVTVISSLYSRSNLNDNEDPRMWSVSKEFVDKFKNLTEKYGGSDCYNIAQVNWQNDEEVKNYYTNPKSRRKDCVQLVGNAALFLGQLLEKKMEPERERE